MQKKKRNKEKQFKMNKVTENSTHVVFSEVFDLPFTVGSLLGHEDSSQADDDSLRICLNKSIIVGMVYPSEKSNTRKLTELVVDILNGQEIGLRIKNVKFNVKGDLDGEMIFINEDPFLSFIGEQSVKQFMESRIVTTSRSAKTIRRSLISYVLQKLNKSVINE